MREERVTMHVGGEGDNACGRGGVTMHVGGEGDNACGRGG